MSEWGNPPVIGRYPCMREHTQGSEASQYLEEEKAIYGNFFLNGCSSITFRIYSERWCESAITFRKKFLAIP